MDFSIDIFPRNSTTELWAAVFLGQGLVDTSKFTD